MINKVFFHQQGVKNNICFFVLLLELNKLLVSCGNHESGVELEWRELV